MVRLDLALHPHKEDGGERVFAVTALAHHLSLHRHEVDGGGSDPIPLAQDPIPLAQDPIPLVGMVKQMEG